MQLSLIPDLVPQKQSENKLPKTRQLMLSLYAPKIDHKPEIVCPSKPQDYFIICD